MRRIALFALLLCSLPALAADWYVRPDGGTRWSTNVSSGQCNGTTDAAYPGTGVNQACAFSQVQYLWDDQSYGNNAWVIAGGDTVIIRGCGAVAVQPYNASPDCRIGWDSWTGTGAGLTWCTGGAGNGPCFNPPIPAGTSGQHTRILGQNYASCNTGGATNPKNYVANLTQLFGGFGVGTTLNLAGAQYVDIQCLELTSHNQAVSGTAGVCVVHGSPQYPAACNTGSPLSDYDSNGIQTDATTANVTLTDVYIHGHTASGIQGPIGAGIALTRVFVGFNGFAGWNFDDGSDTPDGTGASINAQYVTMIGNGCNEQYPINASYSFDAVSCYDIDSGGFGDSWSGQDTTMTSFVCNHCVQEYNTKDGFIGPHTATTTLLIENSESIGNMGQQWKWGSNTGATTTFINNFTSGNCNRLSAQIPGAPQSYGMASGLPGAYLSLFCRAAGDIFSFETSPTGTTLIANNTVVGYSNTVFDMACTVANACATASEQYTNNVYLGYTVATNYFPGANGQAPGLYFLSDASVPFTTSHNIEFGTRNGVCPATTNGTICSDPLLVGEPAQGAIPPETTLDGFNFLPSSGSPAITAGTSYSGLPATDYYGVTTTSPPVVGAANGTFTPPTTNVQIGGQVTLSGRVTVQ